MTFISIRHSGPKITGMTRKDFNRREKDQMAIQKKSGIQTFLIAAFLIVLTMASQASASSPSMLQDLKVGGAYLGLVNFFDVDAARPDETKHDQFDFAVNLNFDWQLRDNIVGVVQIQSGTGGGSLGFAGPESAVTDLNLTFSGSPSGINTDVVIGSFDTPFGEQTGYLTNNANSFGNPLFLNSLFYGAFGGTVGTLNTLGVMGIFETKAADITLAVTNGGDESSSNNGGNFEYVVRAETGAVLDALRFGGSYMAGDDTFQPDPTKADGFASDFKGWMADAHYAFSETSHIKGYVGEVSYGDNNVATQDDVLIWMGEAAYGKNDWQLAVRVSGWKPDDGNGDGVGMSGAIPNPGLSSGWEDLNPNTDQKVTRIQLGASWQLYDHLTAKVAYVSDDYDRPTAGRSTDVDGWMFLLNGSF
ncbi:MAG: porin [Nitrospiria bacterium]